MSALDSVSMNRAERRREQTLMQLRQAAMELIFEDGYANLTIRAITERADLGYGTFYLYFAEKDDIVWVPRGTVHHIRNVGTELSLRLAVAMPPAMHYFSACEQCGFTDDGPREWCA